MVEFVSVLIKENYLKISFSIEKNEISLSKKITKKDIINLN